MGNCFLGKLEFVVVSSEHAVHLCKLREDVGERVRNVAIEADLDGRSVALFRRVVTQR